MLRRTQVHSVDDADDDDDIESPEIAEAGTLAIQNETMDANQKELWKRYPSNKPLKLPTDGSTVLRFEIGLARIMPPEGEDLKLKRYVIYELTVCQDSSQMDTMPAKIERRYTDFRILYTELKKLYPSEMVNINFPNKVLVGNFSPVLIAQRSSCFEAILQHISICSLLRDSEAFLNFLQEAEMGKACQYLDERRHELAIPLLENSFRLLNKIYMDRSRAVLLLLCRLVAACTSTPVPHQNADRWANLALMRYEHLSDIDMLALYIPLLHSCAHLWWQRGRDAKFINDRLTAMKHKGINIQNSPTLQQAIHKLDPRTERH